MLVPRHWRLKKQAYALQGETCPHCRTHLFPPRAVCPHCASRTKGVTVYAGDQPTLALVESLQPVQR